MTDRVLSPHRDEVEMTDSRAAYLVLSPAGIAKTLFAAVAVVVALDAAVALLVHGFGVPVPSAVAWRLDSDSEMSIPTLVNVLLLVIAAAACALAGTPRAPRRLGWWLLACVLGLLAIDDLSMIHEGLSNTLQNPEAPSTYAWIVPYLSGAVLLLALLAFLLRGLPRRTMAGFAGASLVYGAAAAGLEVVAAPYSAGVQPAVSWMTAVLTGVEEALEMSAVVVFTYFVLDYVATESDGVRILIRGR